MILVSSRTRTYSEEITVKVFAILGCAAIFTATCQADVVVYDNIELDNTGAVTNTGGQISIASGGPLYNSFTSTSDGTLTGLSLVLDSPQLDPIFDIVLYANTNTNTPGAAIATLATVSDALIGPNPAVYDCATLGCTLGESLAAGNRYWIGLSDDPSNCADPLACTPTTTNWVLENYPGASDVGVAGEYSYRSGVQSGPVPVTNTDPSATTQNPFMMEVTVSGASSVPEPSMAFPVAGVVTLFGLSGYRRRRAALGSIRRP